MTDEDMEFFDPMAGETGFQWQRPAGYPDGVYELRLYEADDGSHSRFLQLDPGTATEDVLTHEFYEEAYILHGELVDKSRETAFTAGMYARRTPGMEHGPYRSPNGCLTFEVQYYK